MNVWNFLLRILFGANKMFISQPCYKKCIYIFIYRHIKNIITCTWRKRGLVANTLLLVYGKSKKVFVVELRCRIPSQKSHSHFNTNCFGIPLRHEAYSCWCRLTISFIWGGKIFWADDETHSVPTKCKCRVFGLLEM